MSNTTTSYAESNEIKINVVKGTTTGINNTTWYRMYAQQQIYSKKANITGTSSMIWGSQWHQIMIWMKDVDNTAQNSKYIVNSTGMANFKGADDGYSSTINPAPTGCFKVKNVYDLAGNVCDWTIETSRTGQRMGYGLYYTDYVGGGAKNSYDGFSKSEYPFNRYTKFGSRVTIY